MTRQFSAGELIYRQEAHHRVMYRIVSGRVWLSYTRADGREHLSSLLGPGECLGISTLIDGDGLPQNATARTDVRVQVLEQAVWVQLRQKHRSIDDAMMRSMIRDTRILISQLSEASLAELPPRLALRLLALARLGRNGDPVVDLTQTELAATLGVSRQTLNKLLRQFAADGMVRLAYGEVHLADVEALHALALLV
ncbi:Crp/Fnr family transcriptional regulator [Blastococcus brunescens]|uniref:Crp/Fnr family transcriptional regulator n=1 Tax=Blastococcus brunescens TaxID=1564165 RepID=A0ABZ1B3P2_9ACTN|nr:Crp/Fnr family transcriptional regulator [Blastococcus sp. BMG 8361]WRL65427.1 Crp/Fnr family transcriptional regulator [Blastococcus sp. BMG 8361]